MSPLDIGVIITVALFFILFFVSMVIANKICLEAEILAEKKAWQKVEEIEKQMNLKK